MTIMVMGNDDGLNGGHVVVNVKIQFYRTDYTLKSLSPILFVWYVVRDISRIAHGKQQEIECETDESGKGKLRE